jgi:hypothetical protein
MLETAPRSIARHGASIRRCQAALDALDDQELVEGANAIGWRQLAIQTRAT